MKNSILEKLHSGVTVVVKENGHITQKVVTKIFNKMVMSDVSQLLLVLHHHCNESGAKE